MEKYFPLHRPPDFEQKAEVHGWDSPHIRRAIGHMLGTDVVDVKRAVGDSTSAAALIVQGMEARLYATFVQKFPLYDMIAKEEANGLVHAYDQITAYSQKTVDQPVTMSENAVVGDDSNTYAQATTNIAIFGTRRGASLKSMFAVKQGVGPFGDLSQRELDGGLMKIAHDVQAELCRFQNVDNTSVVATAPNGLYDANGFKGLRYILTNLSPPENTVTVNVVAGGAYVPTSQAVAIGIRAAANKIIDAGGNPDLIIGNISGREFAIAEQMSIQRVVNSREVIPGLSIPSVMAGDSELPFVTLPGNAVGTYTGTGTITYQDIYVVDSSTLSLPWLGGPTPTILDIQIGADGTLRKLYIPFLMVGLAAHVPAFLARVQLQTHA